jgi:hypothetical protein
VDIPLHVEMLGPKNGVYVPYVDFTSSAVGNISLALSSAGINLNLLSSGIELKYAFDPEYVKLYGPFQYIAASTIGGALKKALAGQGITIALPSLAVGANMKLVPSAWQLQGNNLLVNFVSSSSP